MSASAFEIAESGMAAHRAEMDVIAANIAHAGTRAADGTPYRASDPILAPTDGPTFAQLLDDAEGSESGLSFALDEGDVDDDLIGGLRFSGSSAGDTRGIQGDDDDPIEQMVSLVAAGRAYDADVASLQAAKQMDVEAIEVDRP